MFDPVPFVAHFATLQFPCHNKIVFYLYNVVISITDIFFSFDNIQLLVKSIALQINNYSFDMNQTNIAQGEI